MRLLGSLPAIRGFFRRVFRREQHQQQQQQPQPDQADGVAPVEPEPVQQQQQQQERGWHLPPLFRADIEWRSLAGGLLVPGSEGRRQGAEPDGSLIGSLAWCRFREPEGEDWEAALTMEEEDDDEEDEEEEMAGLAEFSYLSDLL